MSRSRDHEELRALLARVREIEIRSRRLADSLVAGQYRTAFRGSGIEFEEVREYIPGDDVRSIDWNVTARTGRVFIKKYREERERNVLLAIDVSGSQRFGSSGKTRNELAAELAAVFSLSALSSKDKIGLLLFSDRVEKCVMPRRGRTHGLRLIREVLACRPAGRGTDIKAALAHLNRVLPRRTIVLLVSDFYARDYEHALRLTALRHDLVPVILRDPLERRLPPGGVLMLEDAETGTAGMAWCGSAALRDEFARRAAEADAALASFLSRHHIDAITLSTDEPYGERLMQFFRRRAARQ